MACLSLEGLENSTITEFQLLSTFVAVSSALANGEEEDLVENDIIHRVQSRDFGAFSLALAPLGQGSSFSVYAPFRNNDLPQWDAIAFKRTIPTVHENDAERRKSRIHSMMLELRILAHSPVRKHENIVNLLGVAWEMDPFNSKLRWPVLLMERATYGTLTDYFEQEEKLPFEIRISLSLDVINGLEVLHECGIFHGDLKFENVLIFETIDNHSPNNRQATAKLADFGGALYDVVNRATLQTPTKFWAAPEWRKAMDKDKILQADIYSLGFVVWRVLQNGCHPFIGHLHQSGPVVGKTLEDQVDQLKRVDDTLLGHLDSLLPLSQAEGAETAREFANQTLRVDPDMRNFKNAKKIVLTVSSEMRLPPDFEGLAPHQRLLKQKLIQFAFDGIKSLDPSILRYLSRDLAMVTNSNESIQTKNEAAYGLAVLYINGIISDDEEKSDKVTGLEWLTRAALLGNDRARATIWRAFKALNQDIPSSVIDRVRDWLQQTGSRGFFVAMEDLAKLLPNGPLQSTRTLLRTRYGGTGAERFPNSMYAEDYLSSLETLDSKEFEKSEWRLLADRQLSRYGDKLIHFMVSCNLAKSTAALIGRFPEHLSSLNVNGETPLLLGCRAGNYETVALLLDLAADASIANDYGDTPLHWLLSFDEAHLRSFGLRLLQLGSDINAVAQQFSYIHCGENAFISGTPLMRAVSRNRIDVVEFLLEAGADANVTCDEQSAINLAAQLHYPDILDLLLSKSADEVVVVEESTGQSLLIPAITGGSLEASGTLFGRIRRHGELWEERAHSTISTILRHGADKHMHELPGWGGTAVMLAITHSQLDVVAFLLDHGGSTVINTISPSPGDPDQLCTPLIMSIWVRNLPALRLLLNHGADPIRLHRLGPGIEVTALYECARQSNDNGETAQILIDAGIPVDQRPHNYETPFACSLRNRCFDLAQTLVENNADVNQEFGAGLHVESEIPMTVLGFLVKECSLSTLSCLEFLSQLKDQKPNFVVSQSKGLSALHILASVRYFRQDDRASMQILDFLLRYFELEELQLNMPEPTRGLTALHFAAATGNHPVLNRLLQENADPLIKDVDGNTPLDIAKLAVEEYEDMYCLKDSLIPRKRLFKTAVNRAQGIVKLLEGAL